MFVPVLRTSEWISNVQPRPDGRGYYRTAFRASENCDWVARIRERPRKLLSRSLPLLYGTAAAHWQISIFAASSFKIFAQTTAVNPDGSIFGLNSTMSAPITGLSID